MKRFLATLVFFAFGICRVMASWTPPATSNIGSNSGTVSISVAAISAGTTPTIIYIWVKDPSGTWHVVASGQAIYPGTATASGSYTFNNGGGTYVWQANYGVGFGASAPPAGTNAAGPTNTIVATPITAATIASLTYNFAAQSPSVASSVTPAGATVTVSAPAQTNAGTYATGTVTGTGNYTGTLTGVSWTINKANANTPTISTSANPVTYGGSVTVTPANGTTNLYAWLVNGAVVSTYNGSSWSAASGTYTGGNWSISGLNLILTPTSVTNFSVNFRDTGNGNFNAATSATTNVTVNPASQALSWSAAPTATYVGAPAQTFTAAGSATGTYVWSVSPAGPTGITGNGASQAITFPAGGTFTVSVYSAGNSNYSQSPTISSTMTVDVLPTVSGTFSPTSLNFGQSSTFTFSATQGSTALTGLSTMYWTGSTWATVPGASYTITNWPASYPNDSTYYLYSSSTFTTDVASGSSSSKSFVVTPKFIGSSNGFGVWAWDSSWTAAASVGTGGLTISKATPTGTFAGATKTPQSGATFTAAAGDLNSTFVNPYSGAVAAPTGAVTYTIAPSSPNGTVGSSVVAGTTFSAGLSYVVRASYPGDSFYNATTVDSTWTIAKGNQTITFANPGTQVFGVNLTLGATASSGLGVTYAVSSGPATVAGNVVTFTGAGSVTVTASQAGNANYNAATNVSQTFTVNPSPQTITFPNPGTQTYGTPLTLSATATSGLAVTYAVTSGSATVSGSTVTFTGTGSVTITASQSGNANYNAATNVQQTFTVNPSNQTITFGTIATQTYLTPLNLGATASSGLPVSYAITSGPATVTGNTVTFTGVGTVTVTASQAGNANYNAATSVPQSFAVNPAPVTFALSQTSFSYTGAAQGPTIVPTPGSATFTPGGTTSATAVGSYTASASATGNYTGSNAALNWSIATGSQTITFTQPPTQAFGTPLTLTATASSGLPVSYAVTAGPATVSGSTVTFTGVGSVTIQASQAGNASYGAATPVSQSFSVNPGSQTITFSNPGTQAYGTPLNLTATASSGLAVSYVVTSGPATVAGNVVTFTGPGTVTVTASQAGNANWNAATAVPQTFTVNPGSQTITFNNPGTQAYGTPLTLSATASSGLAVTYAVTSGPATVAGNTVTFTGVGSVTVTASQAGNTNWNAATAVPQTFTVNKGSQTITFPNPGTQTYGTPVNMTATASSGLAITYTIPGGYPATVAGSTVSFTGTGTVKVNADQAGNANWNAASQNQQSFTVNKANQTITFSNPGAQTFGYSLNLVASASSGLAVTSVVTSGPAVFQGGLFVFTGTGSVTITVSQAGNANYNAATSVPQTFTVNKATPTATFAGRTLVMAAGMGSYLVTSFDLNATFAHPTNSSAVQPSGAITYAIATGSPNGTVGDPVVPGYPLQAGSYLIQASSAGDANYNATTINASWLIEVPATVATQLGLLHPSDQATRDSTNTTGLKINKPQ